MDLVFFESQLFTRLLPDYMSDEDFQRMQHALMENPVCGDVMPGTGGFRKLRWHDPKRGKGKRGGLRIIYYYLMSDYQVWLITIYNKDEMIDLSAEEKRTLKRMLQAELAARRKPQ